MTAGLLRVSEPVPRRGGVRVPEPAVDRVDHDEHRPGSSGRAARRGGTTPGPAIQSAGGVSRSRGRVVLDQALAEHSRAGARGVGEPLLQAWSVAAARFAAREVPVQQEQRGEPLLAVEGPERARGDLAVDEVEADGSPR